MSVKNNLKINIHRHSEGNVMTEESTVMYSNVMDPSVGVASLKDDNRMGQRGRSMVEMLGVLAIVGVLSVGGVYGYGVAMKKHKANELLHQASMLATTISAQAMTNDGKLPETITSFGNTSYGTFLNTVGETTDKTGFTITISEMDSAVCTQLEKMAGGMVREATCNNTTATLTYYKNLATTEAEGEKRPTGGGDEGANKGNAGATTDDDGAVCSGDRPGKCSVCLSTGESTAHWYDSDALCTEPGQTCVNGNCVSSAVEEPAFTGNMCICEGYEYCGGDSYIGNSCSIDSDCAKYGTWDETQEKCVIESLCTDNGDCTSDEYCHYTSVDYNTCKPNKKGSCVAKADAKGDFASGATAEANGFIRSAQFRYMDWFSAQNFCRSYGKNLVTLSQMGLGSAVPSGMTSCSGTEGDACNITSSEWAAIQAKFGTDLYSWTANLVPSSSCDAFVVGLNADDAYVEYEYRDGTSDYGIYALCK